jgi:hypothetical protein
MSTWRQALALDVMIPFFLVLGECLVIGVHLPFIIIIIIIILMGALCETQFE